MTDVNLVDTQETIEKALSRPFLNKEIETHIREDPENQRYIELGVQLLRSWLAQPYYESKRKRLNLLDPMSLEDLVVDVLISISYCTRPELFVNVSGQLALKMGFTNHADSIKTIAEIIAVLCHTDAFDIVKESAQDSMKILSNLRLPQDVIIRCTYLPWFVHQCRFIRTLRVRTSRTMTV